MFRLIYTIATGQFHAGGSYEPTPNEVIPVTQAIATLVRMPDFRLERYDGNDGIRPATIQEIAEWDTAQQQERERVDFEGLKMLRALALWTAQKLGISAAQAKQEILVIYRGL